MSEKLSNNNSSSSIVDQSESLEKAENAETIRMERDELKKLIRMCVKEWCETTTSHGNFLKRGENIRKKTYIYFLKFVKKASEI
jgi:hypothetical protein